MARIVDSKRSKTKSRIAYTTQNTRKYRSNNPLKYNAHKIVHNFFR